MRERVGESGRESGRERELWERKSRKESGREIERERESEIVDVSETVYVCVREREREKDS